jgi:predicted dehydrogenase
MMRAFVWTSAGPARRDRLSSLLPDPVDLGDVATADAAIVDGDLDAIPGDLVADLGRLAERGGSVLLIGGPSGELASLAGVTVDEPIGPAEVFLTAAAAHPALARTAGEWPVDDDLVTLRPSPDHVVLLTSSIRFTHLPALVERRVGNGRVVTAGIGRTDAALGDRDLRLVLSRLLRPAAADKTSADLGLAVVGYGPFGGMGYLHGNAATQVDGLEFVAAVDTDSTRRKAAEQEFPGITTYSGISDLLDDDAVDIVVIATPPNNHAALALEALRAGKHVVTEKPMCITVAEADDLIATADAHGLALTVNQNRRWDPDYRTLRLAVERGLVGEVFNMETFVGSFEHPCRAWHSEVAVSGGAIYDWGSHHIDWILQVMHDDPATVVAHGHKRVWQDVTNLDQVRVRLGWADGREAQFLQSDVAGFRPPKIYVQGTKGTVTGHYRPFSVERVEPGVGYVNEESHHAEAPVDLTLARYEPGWGLTETRLPPQPAAPHAFHRNLADHLHLGEPLDVAPRQVRRVIAVLEAAQRSVEAGGTVEHPDFSP